LRFLGKTVIFTMANMDMNFPPFSEQQDNSWMQLVKHIPCQMEAKE